MSTQTQTTAIPTWTLGDRLRKAREHAGLTQTELADAVGIGRRSVSTYESDIHTPNRPVLLSWALTTGVPLDWLTTGDTHATRLLRDPARRRHLALVRAA